MGWLSQYQVVTSDYLENPINLPMSWRLREGFALPGYKNCPRYCAKTEL